MFSFYTEGQKKQPEILIIWINQFYYKYYNSNTFYIKKKNIVEPYPFFFACKFSFGS